MNGRTKNKSYKVYRKYITNAKPMVYVSVVTLNANRSHCPIKRKHCKMDKNL